ncbi:hypothetical protein [Streptomyces netropsis]|uniref:hypothetical protein n=1 Tax=Streptomyces netropsis TaxID=55404 RepID=UPI00167156D3|nr:hypothetical protein [Streptomyces netropsis]
MKIPRTLAVTVPLLVSVTLMTATPASAASYSGGNAYARGGIANVTSTYMGGGIYDLSLQSPIATDLKKKDGWRPILKVMWKDYTAGNPTKERTLGFGVDNGETAYFADTSIATKYPNSVTFKVCGLKAGARKCASLSKR